MVTNFGELSESLSCYHLDDIVNTLTQINTDLFNEYLPVNYLGKILEKWYGATDIVPGWLFLPTELGGLDLLQVRIFI